MSRKRRCKTWYDGKVKDGYPVFVAEAGGRVVGLSTCRPGMACL